MRTYRVSVTADAKNWTSNVTRWWWRQISNVYRHSTVRGVFLGMFTTERALDGEAVSFVVLGKLNILDEKKTRGKNSKKLNYAHHSAIFAFGAVQHANRLTKRDLSNVLEPLVRNLGPTFFLTNLFFFLKITHTSRTSLCCMSRAWYTAEQVAFSMHYHRRSPSLCSTVQSWGSIDKDRRYSSYS